MSTATVTGTISYPIAPGGPSASLVIGAPTVNPTSTTGPQVTFTEVSSNTYSVTLLAGVVTIPFGTLVTADLIYVGSTQAVDLVFSGGADTISLEADGWIIMSGAGITALTAEATVLDASVQVLILEA